VVNLKIGNQILVDKHRDPQGNFIALTSIDVWKSLEPKLIPEIDLDGIEVDFSGEKVILKARSRGKLKILIEKARSMGINVTGNI